MRFPFPLALLLLALCAGAARAQTDPPAPPTEAPCAVCSVREGAGPEPIHSSVVHNGVTYHFCSEACRVEFLGDPEKWIRLAQEGARPATPPTRRPSGARVLS